MALAPPGAQSQAPWDPFVGTWRLDTDAELPAGSVFLIRISIDDSSLIVERVAAGSARTTSRYRLDDGQARIPEPGRPVDPVVAFDQGRLVVTGPMVLPNRQTATVRETFAVARNPNTMERTQAIVGREAMTTDVFRRVPGNFQLHGGSGDSRP